MLAIVFLGPHLLWVLGLVVRTQLARRQRAHTRPKITVAELKGCIERERAEQTDDLRTYSRRTAGRAGLPRGWVWPESDWDAPTLPARPLRSRPYLQRTNRTL